MTNELGGVRLNFGGGCLMGRATKEVEQQRKYLIAKFMEEGLDHHGIARKFESMQIDGSTRPQNIKRVMDIIREENITADSMVASPKQQSIILAEVTTRIVTDLSDIEDKIDQLSRNYEEHAIRVEKLYALKLEYYKSLIEAWAVAQSITGSSQQPKRTGDKTQINIENMGTEKAKELAADVRKLLAPTGG